MNHDRVKTLILKVLDSDIDEPDMYDTIQDILDDWGIDLMAYQSRA